MAEGYTQYQCASRLSYRYMGDFTQPQQKYAGTGENCNIAIPVIFYPVLKLLFGCISTQMSGTKFESRKQFYKYVKNCPKIR